MPRSRINAEPCTGPGRDARWRSTSSARPTAGDVLDTAHLPASRIRDTILGFSLSQRASVRCPGFNTEFDQGKESTVSSTTSTARLVRAPRGTELTCKGWQQEAALRMRSEEHTSELQSHVNLVCRLLLE